MTLQSAHRDRGGKKKKVTHAGAHYLQDDEAVSIITPAYNRRIRWILQHSNCGRLVRWLWDMAQNNWGRREAGGGGDEDLHTREEV